MGHRFGAVVALSVVALSGVAVAEDYRLPPPADSEHEGLELTPWLTLKPFVRLTSYWDSNIYQASGSAKEDDWVTRITPGLDVLLEGDERKLELGYAPSFLIYAENSSNNDVEHRIRLEGEAEVDTFTATTAGNATWGIYNTDPQFNGRVENFMGDWEGALEWQPIDLLGARVEGGVEHVNNYPSALEPFNSLSWDLHAFGLVAPNLPWDVKFEVGGGVREILYLHRLAINPDLTLYNVSAGAGLKNKLIEARVRAGYEWGHLKRRRAATSSTVQDGLLAKGELTWKPQKTTQLTGFAGHRIGYSLADAYQANTWLGARAEQEIPDVDLRVFAEVTWRKQDPLHAPILRSMNYVVGVGWSKWEQLEVGGQVTYRRAKSRVSEWEVLTAGVAVTVRY